MYNIEKRFLSFFLAFVMVFLLLPVTPIEVTAATGLDKVGISGLGVSCKESNGSVQGGAGEVTLSATTEKGTCSTTTGEVSVTFTNNSGAEAVLSFRIRKTGQGTVTYSDGTTYKDGQYSTTLQSEASLKVTFKSGSQTSGTVYCYITSITLASKTAAYDVTVNYDNAMGSVQVNGTAVNSGHTVEDVTATAPITLKAIPATGAKFFGWMIQDTNAMVSQSAEYTCTPGQDMILKAVFIKADGSSAPWFAVGVASGQKTIVTGSYTTMGIISSNVEQTVRTVGVSRYFDNLNDAAEYAKNSSTDKVIVLMSDGTLPAGNYEIPAGVKLLIPYDTANTYGEADPISMNAPESGNSRTHSPQAFRTLTLADGVTLNVSGNIELSALHYASHGGKTYGGTPYQYYGYMKMEESSKIVLNSGAKLYAWGYISGSANAQVIANSGSTVYEKMQVADYRGGNRTDTVVGAGVFPFSQYYIQNVEVKTTIYSGANLVCHATIFGSMVVEQEVSFMGEDAMFTLGENAKATKYYDADSDRLIVDVDGDFSFSSVTILGKNTKNFVLPLQQNLTININSGTTTVQQDIMLQPGCTINVGETAKLNLQSGFRVFLMSASNWGTYCFGAKLRPVTYIPTKGAAPGKRTEANMTDARLNINGTLVVSGAIYATANHANVVSTGKTGVIQFVSAVSSSETLKQCTTAGEDTMLYDTISMSPIVLTNANGTTVSTSGAVAGTKFIYCATHGTWNNGCCVVEPCDHDYDKEGKVTTAPGCETEGVRTYTCKDCGATKTEVIPAIGHDYSGEVKDAGNGTHHYKCQNNCGSYGAAVAHTPAADDGDCTTAVVCTVCGVVTTAAKSHVWGATATDSKHACTNAGCVQTIACKDTADDTDHICQYGCGTDNLTPHEWSDWKSDATHHWKVCACGAKSEEAAHSDVDTDDNHNCDVCGKENVTEHVDGDDDDHLCDYGCGQIADDGCHDAEMDHICDECEGTVGEHKSNAEYACQDGKCEYCGDDMPATEQHSFGTTIYNWGGEDGTCCEARRICNCTYEELVIADIEAAPTKDPTCTEMGETTYTATFNAEWAVTQTKTIADIAATGHKDENRDHACDNGCKVFQGDCIDSPSDSDHVCDYGCGVVKENCSDMDTDNDHNCDVCGASVGGHSHEAAVTAPTCTKEGYTTYTCNCGDTYVKDKVPALGHTKVTDEAKAPTCTETGLTEGSHCSVCGEILVAQEIVDALGHTEVIDEAKAPTCTETGLTEGKHCSVCEKTLVKQETVDALGHTFSYTNDGEKHKVECNNCETVFEDETHDYSEGACVCNAVKVALNNPDTHVQFDGATQGVCGEEYTVKLTFDKCYSAALGDDILVTVANQNITAQCEYSDGVLTIPAELVTGNIVIRVEAKLQHGDPEIRIENEVAADCVNAGSYERVKYCSVCTEVLSREKVTVDANGHAYVDHEGQDATCTEDGWKAYQTCENCEYTTYEEKVALGHKDEAVKDHNCDACGEKLSDCADSDDEDLNCDHCGERMPVEVVDNSGKLQYTVEGEKVTVTNDKACMMYYWDEANQKIVIIEAVEGEAGSYVFTAGEHMDEVHLVVKGDITGDGKMDEQDLTALTNYLLAVADGEDAELSVIAAFIADVNGDGEITSADRVLLARSLLAPTHPMYRPYTW